MPLLLGVLGFWLLNGNAFFGPIFYFSRPILIVLTLILLKFVKGLVRKAAVGVAAFILVFSFIKDKLSEYSPELRKGEKHLSILTFNIENNFSNPVEVREIVKSHPFDMVFAQEVSEEWIYRFSNWKDIFPYQWHTLKGRTRLSVLSRTPFEKVREYDEDFRRTVAACGKIDGLFFCNVHLTSPAQALENAEDEGFFSFLGEYYRVFQYRQKQIEVIQRIAAESDVSTQILAGDFNSFEWDPFMIQLRKRFVDVFRWKNPFSLKGSYPNVPAKIFVDITLPIFRIDYFWIHGPFQDANAEILDMPGSDHKPLKISLVF